MGKLIIFSAPSGSGKSTIVNHLLSKSELNLCFSVSATSRMPRGEEVDGCEYYFFSPDEFRRRIANNEFVEYEEVYKDTYYGTLKSEIERLHNSGKNIVFDLDVVGGCRLKEIFATQALSVFIMPPSVEELRSRLIKRGMDASEVIETRVEKARTEMEFASRFDTRILNDDLEKAKQDVYQVVKEFIDK